MQSRNQSLKVAYPLSIDPDSATWPSKRPQTLTMKISSSHPPRTTPEASFGSVDKKQNRAGEYKEAIARLHDRGICVMAGFISGFDDQDPEMIVGTADRLNAIGIDVPFLSILTPFRGTPLYDEQLRDGRILADRDWPHYNGYNVAFKPAKMSPEALLRAHREMWNRAFSPTSVLSRLARGARQLGPGGMMLSAAMNGFYGLKQLTSNPPAEAATLGRERIAHPDPAAPPERLARLRKSRDALVAA